MLFSLLFAITSFARITSVSGIIKEATTQLPIEGTSISVKNSNNATISNSEEKFRITATDATKLKFSHLGYKSFDQELKDGQTELEIYLEPKTFEIAEVIIRSKPTNELLADAVSASKKKLEKSILKQSYYREFVRVNEEFTDFSDGLLDYNVKRKSGASDVYVKQSRAFTLMDEKTTEREKQRSVIFL